jgi:hypothetical protein
MAPGFGLNIIHNQAETSKHLPLTRTPYGGTAEMIMEVNKTKCYPQRASDAALCCGGEYGVLFTNKN